MNIKYSTLEQAVLGLIKMGRDRCSAGYGKYPLGIRDAINIFVPDLIDNDHIQERIKDFDDRLLQ